MVIIGSDQMYAWKNYFRRPRVFVRVGQPLPPDKNASREVLRDRIVAAWRELFEGMKRTTRSGPRSCRKARRNGGENRPVRRG